MKKLVYFVWAIASLLATAQTAMAITFSVTVPAGTNACWVVGNFNGWNNNLNQMTKVDATHYKLTVPEASFTDQTVTEATLRYKYLSGGGDWAYVEKDITGAEILDRIYSATDVVQKWSLVWANASALPKYVTINVLVPNNVKQVYIVGTFNNWTLPTDSTKMNKLSSNTDGTIFTKTIWTPDANKLLYKFVAGPAWDYQQTDPTNFTFPATESSASNVVSSFTKVYDPSLLGTIKIRANVPLGTDSCWIQGSIFGWDMLKAQRGVKNSDGTFSFVVKDVISMEYRLYNRTDWDHPEVDSLGSERKNRLAEYPKDSVTNITVTGWKSSYVPFIDVITPSQPTGLKATQITAKTLNLSWNPSTDNVGVIAYDLYINGQWVGSTASVTYPVSGLNSNTTYTFKLIARDAAGNKSFASDSLVVKTLAEVGQNLLINSGFETWTLGKPDSWIITNAANGTISQNSTIFNEGNSAAKVASVGGTYELRQEVPVIAGKTYTLKLSYYVEAGDGTDARLWCNFKTAAGKYWSMNLADSLALKGPNATASTGYLPDVKGSWQTYTYDVVAPAGYELFNFSIRTYKLATVSWDNLYLGESVVKAPELMVSQNILTGFGYKKDFGPSAEQSFKVSGSSLVSDIVITPTPNLEISLTSGSGFVRTPLTITPKNGLVDITPIYVRLKSGLTVNTYNDSLVVSSTKVGSKTILCKSMVSEGKGLTFNVKVPVGTVQCWVVGNFNQWNNNKNQMIKVDATHFTLTLAPLDFTDSTINVSNIQYKYLSGGGDWAYVEKDSLGGEILNRNWTPSDEVKRWASIWVGTTPLPKFVTINVLVPVDVKQLYISGNFCNWAIPTDSTLMKKVKTTVDGTIYTKTLWTADANKLQYRFAAGPAWDYEQSQVENFVYPATFPSAENIVSSFKNIFDPSKTGTIRITANVPLGTDSCWINGSPFGWNMANAQAGVKIANGKFSFTVKNVMHIDYRLYNRPDIMHPEVDSTGIERKNRIAEFPLDSVVNITVLGWKNSAIDTEAPTQPTGLKATMVTSFSISLTWTSSKDNIGVTKYYVYDNGKLVGISVTNSVQLSGFSPISSHSIQIAALDMAGNRSPLSDSLLVITTKQNCILSIKSAESGTVDLIVDPGYKPSFRINTMSGWKINSVIFNGIDITNDNSNGVYTLPAIVDSTLLSITFESLANSIQGVNQSKVKVYSTRSQIVVEGTAYGEQISIITTSGMLLNTFKSEGERLMISAPTGTIYLVKTATKTVKVAL